MTPNVAKIYDITKDKWGKPQNYNGLQIYPIKISDEYMYATMKTLLMYNKNATNDKQILKMSYLKFLLYVLSPHFKEKNIDVHDNLADLLKYVFKQNVDIKYQALKESVQSHQDFRVVIHVYKKNEQSEIEDETIILTENDFDNIREIILNQNNYSVEYVDEYDSKLEEALSVFSSKLTLEEQLFSFCSRMKQPITAFEEYTFYQFEKHFERLKLCSEFDSFKPLEMSGQIAFKQKDTIKDWLHHQENKGRYSSILMRKSDFEGENIILGKK